jgi:hypothetical protein
VTWSGASNILNWQRPEGAPHGFNDKVDRLLLQCSKKQLFDWIADTDLTRHARQMRIFNVDSVAPADRSSLSDQLLPDEMVVEAFHSQSATILFTDRRIVTVQLQVLLAERSETSSFSYRAMRQFSMVQGSPPESRSEIRIWLGPDPQPLHLRANAGTDLQPLHRLLAEKLI